MLLLKPNLTSKLISNPIANLGLRTSAQRQPRALAPLAALSLMLALTGVGPLAQAQTNDAKWTGKSFSEDFDDAEKTWTELSLQLPGAPAPANLQALMGTSNTTQRFAIDRASLSIGADGVVRYTLVSTSEYGARNVTYEGIRCQTAQQKLYAIGQPDGKWTRSRNDSWKEIEGTGPNRMQALLFTNYFCDLGKVNGDVKAITERLQKGLQPRGRSVGQ